MKKRILFTILSLVVVFSMASPVYAAESTPDTSVDRTVVLDTVSADDSNARDMVSDDDSENQERLYAHSEDELTAQAVGDIYVNDHVFPDANFLAYIYELFPDLEFNSILSIDRREAIKSMDCSGRGIESLEGIENFECLEELDCSDNQIEEMDLDKCSLLNTINCSGNLLTSLSSYCLPPVVGELDCSGNLLTSLDVNECMFLKELDCSENQLTSLDVSNNSQLKYLYCGDNKFTSLDLTDSGSLEKLDCSANKLTGLDVSVCPELIELNYDYTGLKVPTISDQLKIESLSCRGNGIEALDLSVYPELRALFCGENPLAELDVSVCPELIELNYDYTGLKVPTISDQPKIEALSCRGNGIEALDLSVYPELRALFCGENPLTALDLTPCTELYHLELINNPLLSDLNIIGCSKLEEVICHTNKALPTLYVYGCDALVNLLENSVPVKSDGIIQYNAASGNGYLWVDEKTEVKNTKRAPIIAFSQSTIDKTYGNAAFTIVPPKTETDGTLSYSSSNPAVAVVDNTGKVTIKAPGSTQITLEASAGKYYAAGSSSYMLNVAKASNVINALDIEKTTSSSAQKIAINPEVQVPTSLDYKSSNNKITVSAEGVVTIPKNFVGSATITIKGTGTSFYNEVTKKISITVLPESTAISKLTNKRGKVLRVNWKKNSKASGYQIAYSAKKDFSSDYKVIIKRNTITSTSITSKIKKGKTCYVRIRTYKTVGGKKYYSAWSKALKKKIAR